MDFLNDNQGRVDEIETLFAEFRNLGYTDNEISCAYSWVMERYEETEEVYYSQFPAQHQSSRILTEFERHQLTADAHGFLIRLLHLKLIDDEQFESILERGTLFSSKPVTLEQIKLLSSAVVFRDASEFEGVTWLASRADPPQSIN
jgi:uncharacterized protein Smg (DUF494 family)